MRIHRNFRSALFGLALMLGGCGGLLGGGGRADLYRFGALPAAETPAVQPVAGRPLTVLFVGAIFERGIDGDRIMTVTGSQAAYVARARWIAAAPDLFNAATRRAFDQRVPAARLVRLRGIPIPDYALGIDVRRFEADYVGGAAAPPEVVIEARARLVRWSDRAIIAEWPVTSREAVQENRVATIVDAFDRGTATVVTRIADQAEEVLARAPAPVITDESRQ